LDALDLAPVRQGELRAADLGRLPTPGLILAADASCRSVALPVARLPLLPAALPVAVETGGDGAVHGAGQSGAPDGTGSGEWKGILGLVAERGADHDGVRRGPGAGHAALDQGLGLRLGRGDHRTYQGGVRQWHRELAHEV